MLLTPMLFYPDEILRERFLEDNFFSAVLVCFWGNCIEAERMVTGSMSRPQQVTRVFGVCADSDEDVGQTVYMLPLVQIIKGFWAEKYLV